MKVATLGFEITSHSQRSTPIASSGITIFMSCFTETWHDRRQWSRISPRVKCVSSVDRMPPPPSSTRQRHCAQVPPPPQALARKMPLLASVPRSLPPAGTTIDFSGSPLISMVTSPLLTSLERAARMKSTSTSTITVNMTTPSTTVVSIMTLPGFLRGSDVDAAERHEAEADQAGRDERDTEPPEPRRHVAVLQLL